MSESDQKFEDILGALEKRGCEADLELLINAMESLQLYRPLSSEDLDEIANHLGTNTSKANRHEIKADGVLSGTPWRRAVSKARSKLQILVGGITQEQARKFHLKWVHTWSELAGCKSQGVPPIEEAINEFRFWQLLIRQTISLCYPLSVDPAPLIKLQVEERKDNKIDQLVGLGLLLHPDGEFKIDDQPIELHATPTDRLMGHVLWNLPLNAKELQCGPRVTVNWHCPAETEGSFQETRFLSSELSATELREQQQFLGWIQHEFKYRNLIIFPKNGTWEECWREWNHKFPDWAFPSPGAMRKEASYWTRPEKKCQLIKPSV